MKKMRSFFAVTALLLAVAGAFASGSLNTYYEFKTISGSPACEPHVVSQTCSTEEGQPCSASITLRDNNNVANMCGNVLFRP